MKFVEYDPNTLETVCFGDSSPEALQAAIEAGRPLTAVTEFPADFALHLYNVDPVTKELVKADTPRPDPNGPNPPIDPRSQIMPISDRQFFQKAAIDGFITKEDALSAVQSGFIPAPIQQFIDSITDPDDKFNATMLFAGATTYYRQHHYTELFGIAFGLTPEQVDTFWIEAAKL